MIKLNIGVDIDNTIVNSNFYWFNWLNAQTGAELSWVQCQYFFDMSFPFAKWISKEHALDFWRAEDVYDKMSPYNDCSRILRNLQVDGHKIIFISALKGNHHKSKVNFIKRNFPFYDAFLGTKEKEYVDVDIMIDDSVHVLNRFANTMQLLIQFDRGYVDQPKLYREDVHKVNDWAVIDQIIRNI